MRRLLALLVFGSTLLTATVVAAAPTPSPSAAPEAARGVSLTPDPKSPRRSKSGTFLEFGTIAFGMPVGDAVVLRSTFETDMEIALYAADAQPAVGGGFGFGARTDTPTQVGAWLSVTPATVRVPAGGRVGARLRLTVPKGVEGGEYVGAVLAEGVEQGQAGGVQTKTRFAMAVYLRVPGGAPIATPGRGRPDGRLQVLEVTPGFDGDRACPIVRYRNDSQDIVDPKVAIRTEGLFGQGGTTSKQRTGALLPGSQASVPLSCVPRPIGPGSLSVTLDSPQGGGSTSTEYTYLPTPVVLALVLLLLALFALLGMFLRTLVRKRG